MSRLWIVLCAAASIGAFACDSASEPAEAAAPPVIMGGEVVEPEATEQEGTEEEAVAEAPTSQPTETDDHDGHGTSEQGGRPGPLAPGETGHYGAPFAIEGDPISLTDAIAGCTGTGEPCKVTGTIDRVCQNSGCWFTLGDPGVEATVRIRMVDYGFFVPRNAMGASVVFEGTLELEEIPVEMAQHYADDEAAAGGEARVVDGPELTYKFMITGAEVTAAGS